MDDVVNGHRCGVDAGWRHQLVARRQVGGRKPELAPASRTTCNVAVDEVVMTEQRTRFIHPALSEQPPHAGTADDKVLVADRIDLLCPEPVAGAERAKH